MAIVISKDEVREPLFCVVPLYNPWRFKSRYKHVTRALKHFHDSGAVIILVEIAFNRREFVFADSGLDDTLAECNIHGEGKFKHKYIGLRTKDELWLKEAAINIGVQHLPYDWQQVAWLDGDIHFAHPSWVGQTIQKLQHVKFCQMFSLAHDLDPTYAVMPSSHPHAYGLSWMEAYRRGDLPVGPQKKAGAYAGGIWPGLAWSTTREAWDQVGGLMDFAIWGGSDYTTAFALLELTEKDGMMHSGLHSNYKKLVNEWADRCKRYIRKNVGNIDGSVFHHFHGSKVDRGYGEKHRLLAKIGFDPLRHLKRDSQGLWQLHDDGSDAYVHLRDAMRAIAKMRNEDSTEVYSKTRGFGH